MWTKAKHPRTKGQRLRPIIILLSQKCSSCSKVLGRPCMPCEVSLIAQQKLRLLRIWASLIPSNWMSYLLLSSACLPAKINSCASNSNNNSSNQPKIKQFSNNLPKEALHSMQSTRLWGRYTNGILHTENIAWMRKAGRILHRVKTWHKKGLKSAETSPKMTVLESAAH